MSKEEIDVMSKGLTILSIFGGFEIMAFANKQVAHYVPEQVDTNHDLAPGGYQ